MTVRRRDLIRYLEANNFYLKREGGNVVVLEADERAKDVRFEAERFSVELMDGRTITVPLAWFPRSRDAAVEQRNVWESCGGGYGIHWPEIDEDISTEGLLRGGPAPR